MRGASGAGLGVASSLPFFLTEGGIHNGIVTGGNGYSASRDDEIGGPIAVPNPADGALYVAPLLVASLASGAYALPVKLRGLVGLGHPAASVEDGDTFSGSGELASRSWRTIRRVYCQLNNAGTNYHASGNVYLETTNPEVST